MTVEAKLKITAQADQAKGTLRELGGQLDDVRKKHGAAGQAAAGADNAGGFSKTRAGLESISTKLQDMRTQFLGFLGLQQGAQAIAGVANMSDQYQSLRARLRLVTNGQEEFNAALRTTQALSAKYNQPLAETSTLYTRILSAVKPLNGGLREASVASEAMLASLKISGATSAEAGSAILQFSQALGSGVLRGEEFNAINEAAPPLLDALAKGMGKSRAEMKALAEQGALTTPAIVQALSKSLPELQRQAATIPGTIGGAYDQLKGKVQQFIGQSAETSGSASNAIAVLKLLADNINTVMNLLQGLAALLLAGAIGRGAAGLIALGGGGTAAAAGVTTLGVAMRGLLVLIGGPLGLVVALSALAAGWLGLAAAKNSAQKRTSDQAGEELESVLNEKEKLKADKSPFSNRRTTMLADLDRKEKSLRVEIGELLQSEAYVPRSAQTRSKLRDPATIAADLKAYPSRDFINKEYAQKAANSKAAFGTEIELETDPKKKAELQRQLNGVLVGQEKERIEKIRALTKDEQLTRIAQTKVLYDKDFELIADATEREKKLVQERFDQGLLDLQTYLSEKARLEDTEAQQAIDRLQIQLAKERETLAKNEAVRKSAKSANESSLADEAIVGNKSKIAELEVDIVKKERDRLDAARSLTTEAQQLASELRDQQDAIETQIKQLKGVESVEDIQRRVQKQFAPELAKAFQRDGGVEGDAVKKVQKLIDLTVLKENLARVEREYARMLENIRTQEDAVRIDEAAGAISVYDAERKIFDIRAAQLPLLQAQLAEVEKISGRLSPEDQARAAQAKNNLKVMGDLRTDAEKQIRSSIGNGFGQFFNDIASGTKTVGEALRNMLGNFAQQILNMITQRLGAQLLDSLMPAAGGGAGSSFLGALVGTVVGKHDGGVVGDGGSFTRSVNLAAFAFAPRYHTGGIAGMAPRRSDEMYAVLQKGEEVLTADDPRHIKNMGTGGGGVAVNITVNGAQGDKAAQGNGAADLGRMVESVVDQWAIKQSRPGGMLFGRAR